MSGRYGVRHVSEGVDGARVEDTAPTIEVRSRQQHTRRVQEHNGEHTHVVLLR